MNFRNFTIAAPFALFLICGIFAYNVWAGESALKEIEEASDQKKPFSDENEFSLPKDMAVVEPGYRKYWSRLTGYAYSGLHWNQFVVVYVNKEADVYLQNHYEYSREFAQLDWDMEEDCAESKYNGYSVGTTFLKEHYISKDGKPAGVSFVMLMEKKESGYDPEYGDWRYVWIDGSSGAVLEDGNSKNRLLYKSCIECHSNMKERDYIFATVSRADSL